MRSCSYYEPDNGISVEEQKYEIKCVKKLLSKASKPKTGRDGYPEFIISSELDFNFIIVIECKRQEK